MELAFAGLHQLLAPVLDRAERLPLPQRDALQSAFGVRARPVSDHFLVAVAALSLFSDVAEERPLLCVVDDEQWLDRASAQALGFVARRLEAESVGLVFSARAPSADLHGLPELVVRGLREADARALLDSVLAGPLDPRVLDQIVAESRGNPLALLELPRGMTPAELAGGFGLARAVSPSGRIEESFRRRLDALPPDTQRLLLIAAADPVGEPLLVWGAVDHLEIAPSNATPAVEAGLFEIGTRIRFRHPVVRAVVYQSAPAHERQEAHRALAEVTDPELDPDRRAWHRAHAAVGPDEEVAEELARSADRAQSRGGLAAAAAFLEQAAMLTPEPARRAQRLLAAARAKRDAGAFDEALGLLVAVEAGPPDVLRTAEVEHLRGQIALVQLRIGDAVALLLSAARRLEPIDPSSAREKYLDALTAAAWAGDSALPGGRQEVAQAARAAPPSPDPPRPADVVLNGFALRMTEGYEAAAKTLTRGVELALESEVGDDPVGRARWLVAASAGATAALELWDAESAYSLAARQLRLARNTGTIVHVQLALRFLAWIELAFGELSAAALLLEEDHLIAEATRNPSFPNLELTLAAWRGQEAEASQLIERSLTEAIARGWALDIPSHARSVLYNGLGRHDVARDAAWESFERDAMGNGPFIVSELAEAASRTGDKAMVEAALRWLSERTNAMPSEWALGIETRVRALLSDGIVADSLYRESIARLGRTRVRAELGRGHLLYGEWLRRENRRVDAREHLRTAHAMFSSIGANAFAEHAHRELRATGETVRKRTMAARDDLTPQETLIARLAGDGLSNPEIGMRLFISPGTVKYHLRKVFVKLGISSRNELYRVLAGGSTAPPL
jgi:DNA-binding CsgD family transcriptional regulator/tetratricopeptide (TPR) repeat protein